ncbi:hypothetical protein ACLOJK_031406 [Asimina triloba]
MVLRTPLVEEACGKNDLNFVQMLQPFCLFKKIDGELQMFKLRLAYASEIRQQNVGDILQEASKDVLDEHLKHVVSNASEEACLDLQSGTQQLENVAKAGTKFLPSWFHIFNKELLQTVSFSEHEAFDHPVACLLVVSSKDEKPINKFVDLFNTNQLPSLLNDGVMDPKILKYYLLVHDTQDGTPEKANGCFLNTDDINEIKDLMQDFSSKHIIPFMEQKIRVLNQQVSATRKGFRNQIKNLWWRKGKDDGVDSLSSSMYTFSSTESQIRVLGDYAFMLRDYELALSSYRLLSTDYKLDKAWKRFADIINTMILKQLPLLLGEANEEYGELVKLGIKATAVGITVMAVMPLVLKIGSSGQRNATRCGLWWAEMLKAWGQHKEAAGVYFRISHEEPRLHAAVILEQSAYCFLCSNPPMLRKYGFHLVLAGNFYDTSDQLPNVYMPSLRVIFEDHRVYASPAAVHVKESFWQSLEEEMVPAMSTVRTNWLDSQPKSSSLKKYSDFCVSVAGEAIRVQLEFKNPLQTSISVSDVSLVCEHSIRSEPSGSGDQSSEEVGEHGSTAKLPDSFQIQNAISNREANADQSSFVLSKADFALRGGEIVVVQLTVTPKVEGFLKIIGVRWTLFGHVVGYLNFDSDIPKKKLPKGRRNARFSPRRNLKFIVIKSVPKLEGHIHNLPRTVYMGDFRRLILELRNPSQFSVKQHLEQNDVHNNDLEKRDGSLFLFPKDTAIQGGTSFLWPLWLHAGVSGRISLHLSVYYEIDNVSCEMSYRTLRMIHNLEVLPSLDVSFHITPCPSKLQEFLVRTDIDCRKSSNDESRIATYGVNEGSDVILGSQGKIESLLDISCSPLVDFHQQERLHQEKAIQECPNTVDFILISQPQDSKNEPELKSLSDTPRLLSHHSCLCSIAGTCPIWWLMDGPRIVHHDFSTSFCETRFSMTIHNSSDTFASIKINTSEAFPGTGEQSDATEVENLVGWHDLSLSNDTKVSPADAQQAQSTKPSSSEGISPFIWCASSSTRVVLDPMSTAELPLQIRSSISIIGHAFAVRLPGFMLRQASIFYALTELGISTDLNWCRQHLNKPANVVKTTRIACSLNQGLETLGHTGVNDE